MVTQIPELLSVGFSQKITDSLPLSNCLRTWKRMIPHYRNVINCSSIFIIWMWKLFYEMANNRLVICVMTETPLEIQNNLKSSLSHGGAKSQYGGSSGDQVICATFCLLLQQFIVFPVYLQTQAVPWVSAWPAGVHTPRRRLRESREIPAWGWREWRERGVVQHGWGKAEAQGLQSGSQAGSNIRAERHGCGVLRERKPSLDTWSKHGSSVGKQHSAWSVWEVGGLRRRKRNLLFLQEKAGTLPPATFRYAK